MKRKTLAEILIVVYMALAFPTFVIIPTMAILHDVGNWGLALVFWIPSIPSPFLLGKNLWDDYTEYFRED